MQLNKLLFVFLPRFKLFNKELMGKNLLPFFIGILLSVSGCQKPLEADFEVQLDPSMPGRVKVFNRSTNANTFEWQVWLKSSENGTPYQSSTYGAGLNTSDENPSFYIQENTWIQIDLRVTNAFLEAEASKSIEVANLPDTLIIGNLVITSIDFRDENGYEWDDMDGTPNFGDYTNSAAYPDLIVNTNQWGSYSAGQVQEWDMNFETDLPYTSMIDVDVYDNFGPQTDDFYVELIDFDGPQGSIFTGPGKRIGYHSFNPYHLTHVYNDGDAGNYPEVYHIVTDHFEADLYLTWQ